VADQQADHQGGHGQVVAVAQQDLGDVRQGHAEGVDELIGEAFDGQEGADARVRADRRAAVPRPHVLVANAMLESRPGKVQLEPEWGKLGRIGVRRLVGVRADTHGGSAVEHPVDQSERIHGAGVEQPVERPEIPPRQARTRTARPRMVADALVEQSPRFNVLRVMRLDEVRLGQGEQQLGLILRQGDHSAHGLHCRCEVPAAVIGQSPQERLGVVIQIGAEHGQCFHGELVVVLRRGGEQAITDLLPLGQRTSFDLDEPSQPGQHHLADLLAGVSVVPIMLSDLGVTAIGQRDERTQRRRVAPVVIAVPVQCQAQQRAQASSPLGKQARPRSSQHGFGPAVRQHRLQRHFCPPRAMLIGQLVEHRLQPGRGGSVSSPAALSVAWQAARAAQTVARQHRGGAASLR
jgi:hypothetical protein